MTDSDSTPVPSAPAGDITPRDATPTTGGGITFDFQFNNVTYTVKVYAPDTHSQYGFSVSQAATDVASLTYKDDANWQITVGLPTQFKVDDNLTINTLNVNLEHGAVQPLG